MPERICSERTGTPIPEEADSMRRRYQQIEALELEAFEF